MKFSWKWLNALVNLNNITLDDTINRLTLAGIEVEEVENKPEIQDKTITVSITANRSDVTYMIGLAREVATIFNLIIPKYNEVPSILTTTKPQINNLNPASNSLLNMKVCTLDTLESNKSPLWLQNYLQGCDIKPSNLFHDITRYINLKWGQDIEIFDISKIDPGTLQSSLIKIENSNNRQKLINTAGFYNINDNTSVDILTYKDLLLSIIGIKSNPDITCDSNTSSIMILGQVCHPDYIKKIATNHENKTDKSNRQLKGISQKDFLNAYSETLSLVQKLTKGRLNTIQEYNPGKSVQRIIEVQKAQIINLLGPSSTNKNHKYLSEEKIYSLLKQLKFQPEYKNSYLFVTIPEYRQGDLKRSIDVIEEIGRIYGFEKFLDKIPKYQQRGKLTNVNIFVKKIRQKLRDMGLHEVIHYSLKERLKKSHDSIKIYNPLLEEQSELRNSLIHNLLNTKKYNLQQTNLPLECFEIGRVFHHIDEITTKNVAECINVAGVLGKPDFSRRLWSNKIESLSWFQAKGILEELFEKLNANIVWLQNESIQTFEPHQINKRMFHPHRTVAIANKRDKKIIGILGQISSKYNNDFKNNHNTYVFELNICELIRTIQSKPNEHLDHIFKSYSKYPGVTRDISLKLNLDETAESIKHQIFNMGNSLIESIKIFNEYNDESTDTGIRSLGLRITYRAANRTLSDDDLQTIDNEIEHLLQNNSK